MLLSYLIGALIIKLHYFINQFNQLIRNFLLNVQLERQDKRTHVMDGENVWFDGVDKKLIATHSSKITLAEGNDQTLMTKTPLASFSSYAKKRKLDVAQSYREKAGCSKPKDNADKPSKAKLIGRTSERDTIRPNTGITDELAMDCEMVECYHHKSVLARVSIVNLFGHPILDRYVAPPSKVTDYRTRYSGIRRRDLADAPDFETVQKEVADIIKNRIVIGHAVHNDFGVLKISHPPELTRDTSIYYKQLFQGKTPGLKKLSESILGLKIQKGEHDSVQDAQATMKLYVKERDKWNERLMKGDHHLLGRQKQKKQHKLKKVKKIYTLHDET